MGTKGTANLSRSEFGITGPDAWHPGRSSETDSHQLEQDAMFAALRSGRIINNAQYMANSTLMAIMARESAYTGQSLTWDQMLASQQQLRPDRYTWDGQPPKAEVAIPGVTAFV
jgi:hypothetical protein